MSSTVSGGEPSFVDAHWMCRRELEDGDPFRVAVHKSGPGNFFKKLKLVVVVVVVVVII